MYTNVQRNLAEVYKCGIGEGGWGELRFSKGVRYVAALSSGGG
jgi:hypothetical protein